MCRAAAARHWAPRRMSPIGTAPGRSAERFPALRLLMRNRNFRQLNLAIFVSSVGDPLTLAVSLVLLYSTYSSALAIGAAYGCRVVAALLVGSGIGSLADRLDRRRLVVRLELARCALVATMPIVTSVSVLLVLPYLALLGGIEALVQPARQAAVPHMVGEEQIEVSNSVPGCLLGLIARARSGLRRSARRSGGRR
ncbi:MAG: hypothetical protein DLM67_25855 [Candidatus Nephthysia bennettiae]|uniref:MFS transporter n=1 Tax=Candidatus Nephthysia bennettiae TaxID=3127016 RepID=UPI000DB0E495|nr:MAG: hypothetical protein DLM67_25855 [Candidatus Dormibacteraeota bacterium]